MSDHKNYLDTYWYRVNVMGNNHKDRELNASIKEFEKYLEQHPSAETVKIRNKEEVVSIISDKQNENKMVKKILTRLTSPIQPGDIMEWKDTKWIAYFQEKNPNESYLSNLVVACNNVIRWISPFGVIKELPCYLVGSMSSSIKNNFRTWNATITPQPNQYLDMLIPLQKDITIGAKFLISERAWIVVEYDITSVPGIMYVSLTEDKIDRMNDDVILGVAEYDNLNNHKISISEDSIQIVVGESYFIHPEVYYMDQWADVAVGCKILDETIGVALVAGSKIEIFGLALGNTSIRLFLKDEPEVFLSIPIEVVAVSNTTPEYRIFGPEFIRLGMSAQYILQEISSINNELPITTYSFDKSEYVKGSINNGVLTLTANEKGNMGNVVVTVTTIDNPALSVSKTISIKTLW